jgi:hypothetical protein
VNILKLFQRVVVIFAILAVSVSTSAVLASIAQKFQLESHMMRQFLLSQGVQLP